MNIQLNYSTEKNDTLVNKKEKLETCFFKDLPASSDEKIFTSASLYNIRRRSKTTVMRRRFF